MNNGAWNHQSPAQHWHVDQNKGRKGPKFLLGVNFAMKGVNFLGSVGSRGSKVCQGMYLYFSDWLLLLILITDLWNDFLIEVWWCWIFLLSHFSHERCTFYHASIDVTAINIFVKQVSSFCHPFIIYFLNINVRAQMSAIFTQGNRFAPLINKRTQRVGISLQLLRAWPIDVCNSCYCSWRTLISSVLHPGIKWSDFSFSTLLGKF